MEKVVEKININDELDYKYGSQDEITREKH